jgi:hypothetical protein
MNRKIKGWWDNTPGNPGWYIQELDEQGQVLDDSMKVWFPIPADEFQRDEGKALIEALAKAFPEHEIYLEPN